LKNALIKIARKPAENVSMRAGLVSKRVKSAVWSLNQKKNLTTESFAINAKMLVINVFRPVKHVSIGHVHKLRIVETAADLKPA
jgi:hypothetical protein